jgi:hypothetical protein
VAAGSPSEFARPPMPVLSKCGLCPKEWTTLPRTRNTHRRAGRDTRAHPENLGRSRRHTVGTGRRGGFRPADSVYGAAIARRLRCAGRCARSMTAPRSPGRLLAAQRRQRSPVCRNALRRHPSYAGQVSRIPTKDFEMRRDRAGCGAHCPGSPIKQLGPIYKPPPARSYEH